MVATFRNTRERSQIVSLDQNRPRGTVGAATPVAAMYPYKAAAATQALPVAFTDNTVPVRVLPEAQPTTRPHLVPVETPSVSHRKTPLLVQVNKALQTALVAMCGIAICAYGLDVVVSNDVGRLQEQARRLSEQNSELSAQLLKTISYGQLQNHVVGRYALRVPDQVQIIKEVQAPAAVPFKARRHQLPLMSGY
ncbi:MAG: hypothetical protein K2Z81_11060 [Cyanobacteria bacterium]|nr:hypothetical protein [Cyanobacteriota bacterium]